MLKKSLRLNLSTEFKKVAAGRRFETAHFVIFKLDTHESRNARVGVAVGKKHFKRAHERNRAKRLAFQVMESQMDRLSNGVNLVIMPKSGVTQTPIQDLINEINNLHSLYTAH